MNNNVIVTITGTKVMFLVITSKHFNQKKRFNNTYFHFIPSVCSLLTLSKHSFNL